jgi:putative long chain acyl-CoA synthase
MVESTAAAGHELKKQAEKLGRALQNALEVARLGRLTPERRTPYTVEREERVYRLRHYAAQPGKPRVEHPLLLIPALMINSEIYDIEPESSAVSYLSSQGIDTWVCDFGVPEQQQGGLERTQDDHVRAINTCIDLVRELTGHDVHLAGYSQGGMFAYQVAAWRRSEGIRSLITFGSPVDVHAMLPGITPATFARYLQLARTGVLGGLGRLEAMPGSATSLIFKLISLDKRASQFMQFVGDLHDRQAIERGEGKRRFLAGDGFVAWPGPALKTFADEFVVGNRLMHGGFVVDGRACSLSDIHCPLLYFFGERDDIARPRSVRAIEQAAPNIAELYNIGVPAGHIGLVVSAKAFEVTWPSVVEWLRFREGKGPKPARLVGKAHRAGVDAALDDVKDGLELIRDASSGFASALTSTVGRAVKSGLSLGESLRFQVSRLAKLERLTADTRISFGLALEEKAERHPDGAWFIYDGRGQSYGEANRRVDHVVRGLIACGVRPKQHVGVLMQNRPSYLSLVTALSRLGAVAVLLSPDSERASLGRALELAPVDVLVSDPQNVRRARDSYSGKLLMLGAPKSPRPKVREVIDMETIDTERMDFPDWYVPNPGRAEDLAMIMFTAGRFDEPRAARITNRRWAVAAYGAAAAASLSPKDTVYACTPLHHASGMLVAAGGALVGGARLALTSHFAPERFWPEVRRYGATVVFYAGEMLRELVDAPSYRGEQQHPIRLFAGSGIRRDIWRRLSERFGAVSVLEFYASTEGTGVLANVAADKVGSLGRPLPGSNDMLLVAYDFAQKRAQRDEKGLCIEARANEPGILLTRVDPRSAQTTFDGFVDDQETASRLRTDVMAHGDTWFVTGDVMKRDSDGDYWFLDRLTDVVRTSQGPVFTRPIEDALYELSEVKLAVAYASDAPEGSQKPVASLVLREGRTLKAEGLTRLVNGQLVPEARPSLVRVVAQIALTDGYRPLKGTLRADDAEAVALYGYDEQAERYLPGQPKKPAPARPAEKADA